QTYHPRCFKCCECGLCLDGLDFAVNEEDSYKIYCHKDYFKIFSPRCAVCNGTIDPIQGTNEVVRVVSADADYHIDCYKCQRCQMQLTDEPDKMCYPLGKMLFCYNCRL
ncbi:hypothetical protein HELRODRAFT_137376, partial [Helobdella robusta]|uniref:LIM zinc-binding domain-containing protein n=1 Tax=Helobdella robusta TaxID=6412 RepID=T1EIK1_HELRO